MRAIVRTIEGDGRGADPITLWPLGDVHVGAAGCDEKAFTRDVNRIAADPSSWWIGLGDYMDLITLHDPRFDTDELAPWLTVRDLRDIVTAQRDRFLEMTRPIWGKCLALVAGNHEGAILRHYERDAFREIVGAIQPLSAEPDVPLALEYEGYLRLKFLRLVKAKCHSPFVTLDSYVHHGGGGGRLMGAKALVLGREAGYHDVDVIIMGHVHAPIAFPAWRRWVDRKGQVRTRRITALVSGTYSIDPAYARRGLYPPGGDACPRVIVSPWGQRGLDDHEAVRVLV